MNAKFYTLIGLLLCTTLAFGQEEAKLVKGNMHYANYTFAKAIEQFESLTERDTETTRKLADSYRYIGETEPAEQYYAEVVNADDRNALDYFFYAQMLKSNGKYSEAQSAMGKFQTMNTSDSRAKMHLANANYYEKLQEDQGRFEIRNLDINTSEADFGPAFYGKEKVVFASTNEGVRPIVRKYNWNGKPFLDLYVADKAENGDLSERTGLANNLNTKLHEGTCVFNADQSRIYFTRNNFHENKTAESTEGVNKLKLFMANKKDDAWEKETAVHFNSNEYSVGHPTLSADGKTLYFASDMPGGRGGVDVYKVDVKEDGTLGSPINLGDAINTEGNEMFPFMHAEGNLFFASDGHPGLGGLDVFMATAVGDGFGSIMNLGYPLNDKKDDFSLILDKEMKKGYFSSNRPGGKGDDDIYAFNLLKPLKVIYLLKGYAKDKRAGSVIPGAIVELKGGKGVIIGTATADDKGFYQFEIEPEMQYQLTGTMEEYFDGKSTFDSKNLGDKTVIEEDVLLEKDPGLGVYCLVTDKASGEPIEGVHITVIDNLTNTEFENLHTPATGDFMKPLADKRVNDRLSYQIKLEREGYLSKNVTFNHEIKEPGIINLHEKLDVSMDKIGVGMDLAKIIEINPIYFDLNKSNIREDAAVELEKIVKVMNENPTMEIELGSHTDCRASKGYNSKLSDRRAKSSAKWVQERIGNPDNIYGKGYGESQLVNKCECEGSKVVPCTEEEHQENRRTEFKIIKM